jgi:hypothetical protein
MGNVPSIDEQAHFIHGKAGDAPAEETAEQKEQRTRFQNIRCHNT